MDQRARITIGVRPEDLVISDKGQGLPVEVDVVEELGADGYLYGHADVDGKRVEIVARVDGRNHPNPGESIIVNPTPAHIHAFDFETGQRLSKPVATTSSVAS